MRNLGKQREEFGHVKALLGCTAIGTGYTATCYIYKKPVEYH